MTVVAFAIVIAIIVLLLVWAVDGIPAQPPSGPVIKVVLRVLIILVGVLLIAQKAGLL